MKNEEIDVGLLSKLAALELKQANQANWNSTSEKNIESLLSLMNAVSLRMWKLENSMEIDSEGEYYRSLSDHLNVSRLNERESIFALNPLKVSRIAKPKIDEKRVLDIDQQWAQLEKSAPKLIKKYKKAFNAAKKKYETDPTARCSTGGHEEAELFRKFILPYLSGNILDVGCGPQKRASYLKDIPGKNLYGVDPLLPKKKHDFEFVHGFGEFLPWNDKSFDVIVAATTLDHYLLLDQALSEVFRCLKPGGFFLCWITVVEGAQVYDPKKVKNKNEDDEHLFHIDREWLDPKIEKLGMEKVETMSFKTPFNFDFFSFRKK